MGHEHKRSGQIPPFGNWDYANDLPITQYFESARQAGLVRYSSSSGDSGDLYGNEFVKSSVLSARKGTKGREKRGTHEKEHQRKQGKVCDVTKPPRKPCGPPHKSDYNYPPPPRPRMPKAVDEDLYKIPPELLHTSKRKKMLGFFSRCLVPACSA